MALTPIFHDIDDTIRQQIKTATTEIIVNVPWFTDESLFNELVAKARVGVAVSIGIEDDQINRGAAINHNQLAQIGGWVYWHNAGNKGGLNHEKYCIIDRCRVLFGSYNWTYRAATHNRESILMMEDAQMAEQYFLRFLEMTQLPTVRCVGPTPPIAEAKSRSVIDVSFFLKAEILVLEAEVTQLETEKADLEQRLEYTANQIQMALHTLLVEKLNLETQLAAKRAKETDKAADRQKADKQQQRLEEAEETFRRVAERQQILDMPVDEALLKKLYREACMLAHPDKFMDTPEKQERANNLMAQIADAYRNKDLDTVRAIWQRLQDGTAFGFDWNTPRNASVLNQIRGTLQARKDELTATIHRLQQSFIYTIITQYPDLSEYIASQRQQLQQDIAILRQSLSAQP
ncbi:DUF1669 domain-containing protein [Rudanella paleaurantiibacter]|uniref:phospholipase D n=1 Tax=Rudanella paleaurantiibacter TaxID=2614655 RepID=A0A7J5TSB4_9BACT|nr:phospholipase D-like domain-containing protein [Rudanella paleaurantiibacter]KAB7725991.1 DUF1669 domain-containing protein [Rudanella paleaurantiibacter]